MFNTLVAIGTILLQIGIVLLIVGWMTKSAYIKPIVRHAGLIVASIFSLSALLSLVYQYGLGYEPCILCWYQRIVIFPVAILGWTASATQNRLFQNQLLSLLIPGFLIALFHVFIEQFPGGIDICAEGSVSCTVRYVYEFGYITIPVMSLTVLTAGVLLVFIAKAHTARPTA